MLDRKARQMKTKANIACLLLLCIVLPGLVEARTGSVGLNLFRGRHVDSSIVDQQASQLGVELIAKFNFRYNFLFLLGFEAEVESSNLDAKDRAVKMGFEYLILPTRLVSPTVNLESLLYFDPELAIGSRGGLGIRTELYPIIGIDGLNLRYQIAFRSIYKKAGSPYHIFEFLNFGIEYVF